MSQAFCDFVRIHVKAGNGGNGAIAFRREKYVPKGGPAGGRGGDGGSVILEGDTNLLTLLDLKARPNVVARSGENGQNWSRTGHSGEDVVIRIPLGTLVVNADTGEEIGDVTRHGQRLTAARGGTGGRGNESFVSSTHRTPRVAEEGQPGEERNLILELKVIADVGLVGLPNAGKSTLLAALTNAHPKIAPYPFTTLHPNLGIMADDAMTRVATLADIPGLIEGAHKGAGLGDRFLRHIERTKLIVHIVSPPDGVVAADGNAEARRVMADDLVYAYQLVHAELLQYSQALADKPTIVCLNKTDLMSEEMVRTARRAFTRLDVPFTAISADKKTNLHRLRERIWAALDHVRREDGDEAAAPPPQNPDSDKDNS